MFFFIFKNQSCLSVLFFAHDRTKRIITDYWRTLSGKEYFIAQGYRTFSGKEYFIAQGYKVHNYLTLFVKSRLNRNYTYFIA